MPCSSPEPAPRAAGSAATALLLRLAARVALKPALSPKIPIPWQRRWLELLTGALRPRGGILVERATRGGVNGEWINFPRAPRRAGRGPAILYLHGGGYCIGSPATHRRVTGALARATGFAVFAADYRLAPEHKFPAAVDDALAAYRALAASGPVVIAGDSAGGGLSLAAALAAKDFALDPPAALVLLSPWVDLTTPALPDRAGSRDAVLSKDWLQSCAHHYVGAGDARAPLASPINGDLRGLPPTLVQVAADELLCSDAVRLHSALLDAGVTAQCEKLSGWHGFHLYAGMLPAADLAIERAARFIVSAAAGGAPPRGG